MALVLANQQQIEIGSDVSSHIRIFLVQENEAQGVGVEWARPIRKAPSCSTTSVNYLLWEGEAESAAYCQCYDPLTKDLIPDVFSACSTE